jgi:membrane protease YdiL (CAAX protease family)
MNNKVEVDFGGWIQKGFELWKQDILLLAVVSLIAGVGGLFSLLIIAGPLMVGMFRIVLALHDKTQPKPEIGDVFKGFDLFGPGLVLFLLLLVPGLATIPLNHIPYVGHILSTALSLAIGALVMFSWPFLVDKKMAPIDAIKASFNIVKDNFFPFLGLYIVATLIGSIGFIGCCIGIFVTMPITVCINVVAYRAITGGHASAAAIMPPETMPPAPPPPPSGPPPSPPSPPQ